METDDAEHKGPICKKCGLGFYYDFIPERHDGSGMCWYCFVSEEEPATAVRIRERT